MDVNYWRRVADTGMTVPSDRRLADLTAELVETLGSPDADLRDGLAFPVLATWVERGVYDDLLTTLGDAVAERLVTGLADPGTDEIFCRSFSALVLAACVRRDTAARLLPAATVLGWADRATAWYVRERDCRGWVPGSGWAHAVAHGADLIGALAQSPHLTAGHLRVLLDVVVDRLRLEVTEPWVDGEDDRLAFATVLLLQRNLLAWTDLAPWVEQLGEVIARTTPDGPRAGVPTVMARHASAYARALHAQLATGIAPDGPAALSAPPDVRADLVLGLLRVIPRLNPWLTSDRQPDPE